MRRFAKERHIDEFCVSCKHADVVDILAGSVYCDVLNKTIGAWCIRCDHYKKVRE